MESWNDGIMGLEGSNLICKGIFPIYTHYSNIPGFQYIEPIGKQYKLDWNRLRFLTRIAYLSLAASR